MSKRFILLGLVSLIVISSFIYFTNNTSFQKFNILRISSYQSDDPWDMSIEKGIQKAFKESGFSYRYRLFYMDYNNHPEKEWLKNRAKEAKNLIRSIKPDVIIVSDDIANQYVTAEMKNTEFKFVFCGVDNEISNYGFPAKNVTGVIERINFELISKLIKELNSNIKDIVVLTDNSATSEYQVNQFKSNKSLNIIDTYKVDSLKEWKNVVNKYQDKADAILILLYFSLQNEFGNKAISRDVLGWTTANSKIPEIGFVDFLVEDGGLTAVGINGIGQGYLAGQKAIEILKGKSPDEIKIEKTIDSDIYLNPKRASSLNIEIPSKKELESKLRAKVIIIEN